MKKFWMCLGLGLAVLGIVNGFPTDPLVFFGNSPKSADINLPKDKIYPQGQVFPFAFYSAGGGTEKKSMDLLPPEIKAQDQQKLADGKVNIFGPQYELNSSLIEDMAKYNVKGVYTLMATIDGKPVDPEYMAHLAKTKGILDTKAVYESIAGQVKAVAANKNIARWDIKPEELRHWYLQDMALLKTMCQAVHDNDPEKRPVSMYEPGHRNVEALTKTLGAGQDVCTKGVYTNYVGMKDQRVFVRWSTEVSVEAAKAANPNISVTLLPEMFADVSPDEVKNIPAWVKHDIYAGLVAGAKGVAVFSSRRRPKFEQREIYLNAYLEQAKILTASGGVGSAFLFGKQMNDISVDPIAGPATVKFYYKPCKVEKEYPSLSFANIAWDNARYLIIVNSTKETVKAAVSGLMYGKGVRVKELFSNEAAFSVGEGNFEEELPPWGVLGYKIYNEEK